MNSTQNGGGRAEKIEISVSCRQDHVQKTPAKEHHNDNQDSQADVILLTSTTTSLHNDNLEEDASREVPDILNSDIAKLGKNEDYVPDSTSENEDNLPLAALFPRVHKQFEPDEHFSSPKENTCTSEQPRAKKKEEEASFKKREYIDRNIQGTCSSNLLDSAITSHCPVDTSLHLPLKYQNMPTVQKEQPAEIETHRKSDKDTFFICVDLTSSSSVFAEEKVCVNSLTECNNNGSEALPGDNLIDRAINLKKYSTSAWADNQTNCKQTEDLLASQSCDEQILQCAEHDILRVGNRFNEDYLNGSAVHTPLKHGIQASYGTTNIKCSSGQQIENVNGSLSVQPVSEFTGISFDKQCKSVDEFRKQNGSSSLEKDFDNVEEISLPSELLVEGEEASDGFADYSRRVYKVAHALDHELNYSDRESKPKKHQPQTVSVDSRSSCSSENDSSYISFRKIMKSTLHSTLTRGAKEIQVKTPLDKEVIDFLVSPEATTVKCSSGQKTVNVNSSLPGQPAGEQCKSVNESCKRNGSSLLEKDFRGIEELNIRNGTTSLENDFGCVEEFCGRNGSTSLEEDIESVEICRSDELLREVEDADHSRLVSRGACALNQELNYSYRESKAKRHESETFSDDTRSKRSSFSSREQRHNSLISRKAKNLNVKSDSSSESFSNIIKSKVASTLIHASNGIQIKIPSDKEVKNFEASFKETNVKCSSGQKTVNVHRAGEFSGISLDKQCQSVEGFCKENEIFSSEIDFENAELISLPDELLREGEEDAGDGYSDYSRSVHKGASTLNQELDYSDRQTKPKKHKSQTFSDSRSRCSSLSSREQKHNSLVSRKTEKLNVICDSSSNSFNNNCIKSTVYSTSSYGVKEIEANTTLNNSNDVRTSNAKCSTSMVVDIDDILDASFRKVGNNSKGKGEMPEMDGRSASACKQLDNSFQTKLLPDVVRRADGGHGRLQMRDEGICGTDYLAEIQTKQKVGGELFETNARVESLQLEENESEKEGETFHGQKKSRSAKYDFENTRSHQKKNRSSHTHKDGCKASGTTMSFLEGQSQNEVTNDRSGSDDRHSQSLKHVNDISQSSMTSRRFQKQDGNSNVIKGSVDTQKVNCVNQPVSCLEHRQGNGLDSPGKLVSFAEKFREVDNSFREDNNAKTKPPKDVLRIEPSQEKETRKQEINERSHSRKRKATRKIPLLGYKTIVAMLDDPNFVFPEAKSVVEQNSSIQSSGENKNGEGQFESVSYDHMGLKRKRTHCTDKPLQESGKHLGVKLQKEVGLRVEESCKINEVPSLEEDSGCVEEFCRRNGSTSLEEDIESVEICRSDELLREVEDADHSRLVSRGACALNQELNYSYRESKAKRHESETFSDDTRSKRSSFSSREQRHNSLISRKAKNLNVKSDSSSESFSNIIKSKVASTLIHASNGIQMKIPSGKEVKNFEASFKETNVKCSSGQKTVNVHRAGEFSGISLDKQCQSVEGFCKENEIFSSEIDFENAELISLPDELLREGEDAGDGYSDYSRSVHKGASTLNQELDYSDRQTKPKKHKSQTFSDSRSRCSSLSSREQKHNSLVSRKTEKLNVKCDSSSNSFNNNRIKSTVHSTSSYGVKEIEANTTLNNSNDVRTSNAKCSTSMVVDIDDFLDASFKKVGNNSKGKGEMPEMDGRSASACKQLDNSFQTKLLPDVVRRADDGHGRLQMRDEGICGADYLAEIQTKQKVGGELFETNARVESLQLEENESEKEGETFHGQEKSRSAKYDFEITRSHQKKNRSSHPHKDRCKASGTTMSFLEVQRQNEVTNDHSGSDDRHSQSLKHVGDIRQSSMTSRRFQKQDGNSNVIKGSVDTQKVNCVNQPVSCLEHRQGNGLDSPGKLVSFAEKFREVGNSFREDNNAKTKPPKDELRIEPTQEEETRKQEVNERSHSQKRKARRKIPLLGYKTIVAMLDDPNFVFPEAKRFDNVELKRKQTQYTDKPLQERPSPESGKHRRVMLQKDLNSMPQASQNQSSDITGCKSMELKRKRTQYADKPLQERPSPESGKHLGVMLQKDLNSMPEASQNQSSDITGCKSNDAGQQEEQSCDDRIMIVHESLSKTTMRPYKRVAFLGEVSCSSRQIPEVPKLKEKSITTGAMVKVSQLEKSGIKQDDKSFQGVGKSKSAMKLKSGNYDVGNSRAHRKGPDVFQSMCSTLSNQTTADTSRKVVEASVAKKNSKTKHGISCGQSSREIMKRKKGFFDIG